MVMGWPYNVIDKNLHSSVAYASTAKAIWIEHTEVLKGKGNSDPSTETGDILGRTSRSFTEYFTKLKSLWDELGTYQMLPKCKPKCTWDSK